MSLQRPTVARMSFTFQYKPFMWCRLDARLWHDYLFVYLSRRRSRHPIGFQLFILFIKSRNIIVVIWASSFIHDAFMHSLIISFVRTVLRVLSSTHLTCWFGQMLMKAISWMKSLIASPTPRGVPVSPVRSCLGHCIIRFRNPEQIHRASPRRSMYCQ